MTRRFMLLIVFCLFLVGCNLPQGTGPQAWIDAPLDGSSLPLAQTEIVFHAYAAGNPKSVELTINGQPVALVAPELTQPLSTVRAPWTPTQPGRYVIVARTQDQKGGWSESHTHVVVVGEPTITPTPTPTITLTSSPTETPTPTPTETPTPTPTETTSPTPTETASPTPTETASPTPTETTSLTPTSTPGIIFSNLRLSADVFYVFFPRDPARTRVTFTVKVDDPAGIRVVEIYFRLRDPNTGETTSWGNESMSAIGGGMYTYTLSSAHPSLTSTLPKPLTLEYQFIVTHPDLSNTHSPVYSDVTLK